MNIKVMPASQIGHILCFCDILDILKHIIYETFFDKSDILKILTAGFQKYAGNYYALYTTSPDLQIILGFLLTWQVAGKQKK